MEIDFESTMEHIVDSIRTAGYELSDSIVDIMKQGRSHYSRRSHGCGSVCL